MYRDLGFIRVWGGQAGPRRRGARPARRPVRLPRSIRTSRSSPTCRRPASSSTSTASSSPTRRGPYGSALLPDSDDVLAKWMALRGDERGLIAEANLHLPGPPDRPPSGPARHLAPRPLGARATRRAAPRPGGGPDPSLAAPGPARQSRHLTTLSPDQTTGEGRCAELITAAMLVAGLIAVAPAAADHERSARRHCPSERRRAGLADAFSDGTWLYCSGTLIAPTVFLTAAHCGEGARATVTFDPAYQPGDTVYTGTFHADPLYRKAQSDPHDIAVVVLDTPVTGIRRRACPPRTRSRTSPSRSGSRRSATARTRSRTGPAATSSSPTTSAWSATGTLNAITGSWLRISMNPSTGNGGTCYGDSGGPNFLGTTRRRRRDHDHRRRRVPRDERRLPARHGCRPDVPGPLRHAP